eukprot:scaffold428955_cov41-Prasinocladus_malaysianus.AAC.1
MVEAGHHIRRGLEDVLANPMPFSMQCGDAKGALALARVAGDKTVIWGRMPTGGQKHFYMEPMATTAVPQ